MTNSIDDLVEADLILVTGSNTTENHPVIGYRMREAARKGSRLIVVDPREIPLVREAWLWLRQRPGTDIAWINGFIHVILKEGCENRKFLEERTEGFEELERTVESYTPARVSEITGIPGDLLLEAARAYARAERASIVYSMGITQHTTGTDNVKALANLALVCGHIGKPGTGVNPLRGQNNVQGACDMGALPNVLPGYQRVDVETLREKFEKAWNARVPGNPGLTVVEMTEAALEGKIRAMYIMGENPVVSDPDLSHVRKALGNLEFLVVQDIFPTETAGMADVVLPAACFAEKEGTMTSTERRVQVVRKAVPPPGEARQDWEIICDLAARLDYPMNYSGPSDILDEARKLVPQYAGISRKRLDAGEELFWPCPGETHPGTRILHEEKFTRGRGMFHPVEFREPAERPDEEYPFVLSTGRAPHHYHTGTMTRKSAGLNEILPGPYVEINPRDARRLRITSGVPVKVSSRRGSIQVKALLTDRVDEGVIFIPFHFVEGAANVLTMTALDPQAKIPALKVCAASIEKE